MPVVMHALEYIRHALPEFGNPLLYRVLVPASLVFIVAYLTQPRRVYFVRHGETEANARHIRQGEGGPLSPLGRKQADAAGTYLEKFPVTSMVASPFERARETAQIINTHLKVPLTYSPLLAERRNPSDIIGKSDNAPEVRSIVDRIDRIYHEDEYRYGDEENFTDLRDRARRCLDLFASQSSLHVVAVTHSIYLKMVVAYLLYRERLHAGDYVKLSFFNYSNNAGITIAEYNPWLRLNKTRGWRIVEYNVIPYDSTILAGEPEEPPVPVR